MFTQIIYDSRNETGTTKSYATKLAKLFNVPCYNVNDNELLDDKYILCTYTDGLGEVPKTTEEFLQQHSHNIIGVVGNGSSNFKTMGLFAKVGDIISSKYNVELLKKLDMGGTNSDVIQVAKRLKYKYSIEEELDLGLIKEKSTYSNGKFEFKSRIK